MKGTNVSLKRFTKEDIQVTFEHVKRCLTSLNMGEIKIKTTKSYHYTPVKTAKIKKIAGVPHAGKDVRKVNHTYIASRNVK